jgi:hypothetical protein
MAFGLIFSLATIGLALDTVTVSGCFLAWVIRSYLTSFLILHGKDELLEMTCFFLARLSALLRFLYTLSSVQIYECTIYVHTSSWLYCIVQGQCDACLASVLPTNHRRALSILLCSDWTNRLLKMEEEENCHVLSPSPPLANIFI